MLKLFSRWDHKTRHNSRAQAMVEFALVLPILLLLVIAIIDFGRALFIYSQVSNSAREAVRYGAAADATDASKHLNCAGIADRARSMFSLAPSALNVSVYVEQPITGTATFNKLPCATTAVNNGDRVRVEIRATVSLLTLQMMGPLIGGAIPTDWPISYDASRTIVPTTGYATGPTDTPSPLKDWSPPPPTNFQLSCSGLNVSASWTAPQPGLTYRIYRESDGAQVWSGSGSPATNFIAVTSGVAETFGIVSVNFMGLESHPHVEQSITCTSVPPAQVPNFNLTTACAHPSNNDVIASWGTTPGAAYYVIYDASGNPVSPLPPNALGANVTSYTISRAINQGQVLTYHIVAYNADGLPGAATYATVTCNATLPPPQPPSNFTLSCSAFNVSASWQEPVDNVGVVYQIYKGNTLVWSGTGNSASNFDSVKSAGLTPAYYIVSTRGGQTSSQVAAAPVNCTPPPPTNFQLSCSGFNVSASWTEPINNLTYRIYRTSDNALLWSGKGAQALNFTTVLNGVQTGFNLVSVQNGLESSAVSANVTCTPAIPPTNFVVTCSGQTVSAVWVEPTPNTGLSYRIYLGAGVNPVWQGTGSSAANFTTLPQNVPTVFYIASVFSGVESARVASSPVTCSGTVPPPPTNVTMTCNGLAVSAAWTQPTPNTGLSYRIYRTSDNLLVWSGTGSSVSFNSTINGAQSYAIVSVLNNVESTRVTVNVTCNSNVPAPTNFTAVCTNTNVSGAWVEPSPNTGLSYRIYQDTGTTPVWQGTGASASSFITLPLGIPSTFYIVSVLNGVESARTASNAVTCAAPPIFLQWLTTTNPAYPVRMGKGANKQAFFKVQVTFADGTPVYTATVSIYDTGTNPPTLKGTLSPLGATGIFGLQPASTYGNCYNIPATSNLTVRVDASYNGAIASLTGTTTSNNSLTSCP